MGRVAALFLLTMIGCSSAPEPEAAPAPAQAPGPDEKVKFEGNTAMSENDLREIVSRDLKRYKADPRPTSLDDAAYRIEYQYRLDGYDRVRVVPRVEGAHVIFVIEEG